MMKKISIVTVCLNAQETIEQTIQSVLNQTYGIENIEYIIVDGQSTDKTMQIIEKYKDYISYYVSEPDQGIYDAMNKGIAAASKEIIGILNADDWYDSNAIQNVMNCFKENDTDIVYGEVKRVEKDETISTVRKADSLENTWYFMTIWHPAVFVKREVYQKLGTFSTDYKIAADYEFILRCYSNQMKFTYLNKELTYFRSAGISNTKHIKCAEETNKVTFKYIEQAPDKMRVLDENKYRIKWAIFKEKYDTNPRMVTEAIPCPRDKKIIVWGTGIWGREIIRLLKNLEVKIDYLVDSDHKKEGTFLLGVEIKNPCMLKGNDSYVIVATRRISRDIQEQLKEFGVERERYLFLEEWMTFVAEKEGYFIE